MHFRNSSFFKKLTGGVGHDGHEGSTSSPPPPSAQGYPPPQPTSGLPPASYSAPPPGAIAAPVGPYGQYGQSPQGMYMPNVGYQQWPSHGNGPMGPTAGGLPGPAYHPNVGPTSSYLAPPQVPGAGVGVDDKSQTQAQHLAPENAASSGGPPPAYSAVVSGAPGGPASASVGSDYRPDQKQPLPNPPSSLSPPPSQSYGSAPPIWGTNNPYSQGYTPNSHVAPAAQPPPEAQKRPGFMGQVSNLTKNQKVQAGAAGAVVGAVAGAGVTGFILHEKHKREKEQFMKERDQLRAKIAQLQRHKADAESAAAKANSRPYTPGYSSGGGRLSSPSGYGQYGSSSAIDRDLQEMRMRETMLNRNMYQNLMMQQRMNAMDNEMFLMEMQSFGFQQEMFMATTGLEAMEFDLACSAPLEYGGMYGGGPGVTVVDVDTTNVTEVNNYGPDEVDNDQHSDQYDGYQNSDDDQAPDDVDYDNEDYDEGDDNNDYDGDFDDGNYGSGGFDDGNYGSGGFDDGNYGGGDFGGGDFGF